MGLILWVNRRRCSALAIQLVYLYTPYWMPLIDCNRWDLIKLQRSNGYKIGPDKRIAEIFLLKKYSPSCPYIFCSSIVISRSNFPYLCQCSNRTRAIALDNWYGTIPKRKWMRVVMMHKLILPWRSNCSFCSPYYNLLPWSGTFFFSFA